ncbi:MAG: uncharacterized protein A8A55_2853 [Amphiamblys sp. WSBS2006]|nr:MAG: uncharacterized protein A8A55_2853 [Amphiamblys sp. WSBS2006]
MFPFPPSSSGDNLGTFEYWFEFVAVKEEFAKSISLEYIKGIYATWKEKFLDLMKKVPKPSERELQVSFARLLCFLNLEENNVRQFVDLGGMEGDIMVQEDTHKDFVFVEIKKIEEFTMPLPVQQEEKAIGQSGGGAEAKRRENQPLVAEMYQAALYTLYKAIWGGKTGKQKFWFAAMSLPLMMSRFGSVEVDLGADGMLVGKGKLNIGILQVWKSGSKARKTPAGCSSTERTVFEELVELGKNEEEARAGVEAFRAENLSDEEKIMDEYIKNNEDAVWVDEYVATYEFINYTRKCLIRKNPSGTE